MDSIERLDPMERTQQENHENREGDRRRRKNNKGEQKELRFDGIRLNIPIFKGKKDLESY